jgi:hypothetical protein
VWNEKPTSLKMNYFLGRNKLKKNPITEPPTFLSKPDLVVGIPILRANFCFAEVIPTALFQENEKPNFDI